MPQNRTYNPGSFYRMDARTGFKYDAGETQKEWTGQIVRTKSWEPRQPQDFVRGVRDDQVAPDARPRGQPHYIGPLTFQITTPSAAGSNTVSVETTSGMQLNDEINILLDDGSTFFTQVASVLGNGQQFTIAKPLPYSTGNISNEMLVTDYTQVVQPYLGPTT